MSAHSDASSPLSTAPSEEVEHFQTMEDLPILDPSVPPVPPIVSLPTTATPAPPPGLYSLFLQNRFSTQDTRPPNQQPSSSITSYDDNGSVRSDLLEPRQVNRAEPIKVHLFPDPQRTRPSPLPTTRRPQLDPSSTAPAGPPVVYTPAYLSTSQYLPHPSSSSSAQVPAPSSSYSPLPRLSDEIILAYNISGREEEDFETLSFAAESGVEAIPVKLWSKVVDSVPGSAIISLGPKSLKGQANTLGEDVRDHLDLARKNVYVKGTHHRDNPDLVVSLVAGVQPNLKADRHRKLNESLFTLLMFWAMVIEAKAAAAKDSDSELEMVLQLLEYLLLAFLIQGTRFGLLVRGTGYIRGYLRGGAFYVDHKATREAYESWKAGRQGKSKDKQASGYIDSEEESFCAQQKMTLREYVNDLLAIGDATGGNSRDFISTFEDYPRLAATNLYNDTLPQFLAEAARHAVQVVAAGLLTNNASAFKNEYGVVDSPESAFDTRGMLKIEGVDLDGLHLAKIWMKNGSTTYDFDLEDWPKPGEGGDVGGNSGKKRKDDKGHGDKKSKPSGVGGGLGSGKEKGKGKGEGKGKGKAKMSGERADLARSAGTAGLAAHGPELQKSEVAGNRIKVHLNRGGLTSPSSLNEHVRTPTITSAEPGLSEGPVDFTSETKVNSWLDHLSYVTGSSNM